MSQENQRRRQRGEGSLFQRASDGKWVGRAEVGWVNGKRQRKTVYGRTQAEAMRKLKQARQAIDRGDRNTSSMTLARWMDYWLNEIVPHKTRMKPRTLYLYRRVTARYIEPSLGNVRLDRLAPQHVRQLHREIQARGVGQATVATCHRVLRVALNDATREGLLMQNPASLVSAPAVAKSKRRRALEIPEVRRLFAVMDGDRLASRWHTAFMLGLRQGECLGLRWNAVNLEAGVADVATQLQRVPYQHHCGKQDLKTKAWPCGRRGADRCPDRKLSVQPGFDYERLEGNVVLQTPKTEGSTRYVPLPEPLVLSLRQRREQYLAERDQYATDHGLVWCQLDGRPVDSNADRKEWDKALAAAGISHTDQHSARHTTVTLLLALGVPETIIMTIVGHSEVMTTRGYQHTDLTMQRKAMESLGSALLPGPSSDKIV